MARRFFVKKENVQGDKVFLVGQEFFHMTKVLRLQQGAQIIISADMGEEYKEFNCVVEGITKEQAVCKVLHSERIENISPPVTLFQAIMKGEHMDFVVQKSTELNVQKLVPFTSKFVTVKPDSNKQSRFERISIEACKQSNRPVPMRISEVKNFEQFIEELKEYPQIILAYENSNTSAKEVLSKLTPNKKTALIVGSEGGFDLSEVERMRESGAKIVRLGKQILRGETAALTLVSLIMYEFGQF